MRRPRARELVSKSNNRTCFHLIFHPYLSDRLHDFNSFFLMLLTPVFNFLFLFVMRVANLINSRVTFVKISQDHDSGSRLGSEKDVGRIICKLSGRGAISLRKRTANISSVGPQVRGTFGSYTGNYWARKVPVSGSAAGLYSEDKIVLQFILLFQVEEHQVIFEPNLLKQVWFELVAPFAWLKATVYFHLRQIFTKYIPSLWL